MSIASAERLVRVSSPAMDEMLGKAFPVLDSGFIRVIDYMGSDASICQAARISYGAGTRSVSDDESLIRYLMRNLHTTPMEMCEIKLHVKMPMDVCRQWIRHRTANVNEYSTRYSEAIDDAQKTAPDAWRSQSTTNKQGSGGTVAEWPGGFDPAETTADPGQHLSDAEELLHDLARSVYDERLKFGVAREQARKDLPLSTYTELYWKIDLHNLFHFLRLRMDNHAQLEIRSYADVIGNQIVAKWVPLAWKAFCDYRKDGMSLSNLDIQAINIIMQEACASLPDEVAASVFANKRERDEFVDKFRRLCNP